MQTKLYDKKRRNPKTDTFLENGTQALNSCHSLDCAHVNRSIIYVSIARGYQGLHVKQANKKKTMQANRNIHLS